MKDRPGFKWVRMAGCNCAACPWKGKCRGETWPHWIEVATVQNMTPECLAELAIDNGECAAQLEIKDKLLRESLILNVKTQMERLVAWYAVQSL